MRATLKKAGGSLIMTVPAAARDALYLVEGQQMDIVLRNDTMVVEPVRTKPRYTLTELLAQCDPEAPVSDEIQAWIDAPPVGREIW